MTMDESDRQIRPILCPCCRTQVLFRLYVDDGSRTADSTPLNDDEHGKYSICPNCRRKIRMEHPAGIWILARQQDCR
jgi:hypothetical protein